MYAGGKRATIREEWEGGEKEKGKEGETVRSRSRGAWWRGVMVMGGFEGGWGCVLGEKRNPGGGA